MENSNIEQSRKNAESKMEKTVSVLKEELKSIRAGRANPQLLDRITVDYYGTPTPINQLGNMAVPEPRLLTISLWDSNMIGPVEKAIRASELGINPSNDGKIIRMVFPELTEERRKSLVKNIGTYGENAKVAIRSIRRDFIEQLKKLKKDVLITEDDQRDAEEDIQKLTDKYIKNIGEVLAAKEKDIMEI